MRSQAAATAHAPATTAGKQHVRLQLTRRPSRPLPHRPPWEGCFAVKWAAAGAAAGAGGGCGAYFCGWCWRPFPQGERGNRACHAHVIVCRFNMTPGRELFGGPGGVARFKLGSPWCCARAGSASWRLAELLRTLPQDMREPLLQSLARELADARLDGAAAAAAAAADAAPAVADAAMDEVEVDGQDDEMEFGEVAPLLDEAREVLVHMLHTAIVGVQHHVGGVCSRCAFVVVFRGFGTWRSFLALLFLLG